jgi:Cu-Zn family superoxide dismutase
MKTFRTRRFLLLTFSGALITGVAAAAGSATSRATIESRSGSSLTGSAVATEKNGSVEIQVDVSGAAPGLHAVHVHENGDCSAPDAASAGGHFNPTHAAHGAPDAPAHHAGDFGNMTVTENGRGHLVVTTKMLTVAPGPNSIAGRSIVVHEKQDDMKSQPAGNSGGRVGCGVFK